MLTHTLLLKHLQKFLDAFVPRGKGLLLGINPKFKFLKERKNYFERRRKGQFKNRPDLKLRKVGNFKIFSLKCLEKFSFKILGDRKN